MQSIEFLCQDQKKSSAVGNFKLSFPTFLRN